MRWRSVTTRPLLTLAAITVLLCALMPSLASAQAPGVPSITVDPVIAGTPQEGQTLTATAAWTGNPAPTVSWQWLRCSATDDQCSPIAGATSDRYVAAAADIGWELCVELTVTNARGTDAHHAGEHTAVIQAAPAAPPPPPTTTPDLTTTPTVTGTPSAPTPAAGVQAALPPTLLEPFPIVRIRGVLTSAGARITLFTIRVPSSVSVDVRCRGASCRRQGFTGRTADQSLIRLRRFERPLRAGTRLAIKVTQAGRIGKWTTIVIRRGAAPKRSDQCAYPNARVPAPCPSG
jgi:hypothetical protein